MPYNLNPEPGHSQRRHLSAGRLPDGRLRSPRPRNQSHHSEDLVVHAGGPTTRTTAATAATVTTSQGFLSSIRAPLTENSYVTRVDHDFGEKWRFFATYRYMRLVNLTTNQADIGGATAWRHQGDAGGHGAAPAEPGLPGARHDHHRDAHRHQRVPLQLHAQLLAVGQRPMRRRSFPAWAARSKSAAEPRLPRRKAALAPIP